MSEPAKHQFVPIVTITPRADGRFDMKFDWDSSYAGGYTDDEPDTDHPEGPAACDAVDAWVKTQPSTITIPAAKED